jgi:hypothetical protein
MNQMTVKQSQVTKAVRALMRSMGRIPGWIYTNKYDNGVRTVKCYKNSTSLVSFTEQVNKIAADLGAHNITVKATRGSKVNWGPHPSLIVRVPPDC